MARMTDVDVIIKETESILNFRKQHHMPTIEYEALLGYLKNRPTIDAVPVVHGRWIDNHADFECSVCGDISEYVSGYCSGCGARMDGDSQ